MSKFLTSRPYDILLHNTSNEDIPYNFVEFLIDFHIVCMVVDNTIKILIKQECISDEEYYRAIFKILQEICTSKTFYFLKEDEINFVQIFKTYNLPIVKNWFLTVNKIIDQKSLPVNSEIFETIEFELLPYQSSIYKHNKQFYFLDLLVQRIEKRITLSKKTMIGKKQTNLSIQEILRETDYNLCFSHLFPQTNQSFTDLPELHESLKLKLLSKNITQVYLYQADAFKSIMNDQSVVITAPTGNGKTEAFLLPILQKILAWKENGVFGIKAILFYPTKALASDQLTKLTFLTENLDITTVQLDSDVPKNEREAIYQNLKYDILVTTPDLIHYSLTKKEFRDFIALTKILVFDEIHTYTGTFGTHVYYFLRRLERVLVTGRNVQYIGVTATIANPLEFTSRMFEREMVHVDCKTAKKNKTELYCILRSKSLSKYDALFQLVNIIIQMKPSEKILVFRNSQQEAEKTFEKLNHIKNKKIALHRAGITKERRLQIEKELRENKIDVVVTTTTLEVGIDIGGLTTIITPIVPVNRLLQRIGRAGRGKRPAKIFLELEHDPISYYYSTHAEAYLRDISPVNISIENESIAKQHKILAELEQAKETNTNGFEIFSLRSVNEKIDVKTLRGYKVTEKELPQGFYEYYPFNHVLENGRHYSVTRIEIGEKNSLTAIVTEQFEKFDYKRKLSPIIEKKVYTDSQSRAIEFIDDIEIKLANCKIHLEYLGMLTDYKDQVLTDTYSYEYKSKCVIFNFEDKIEEFVQQERHQGVELGSTLQTLSHAIYKASKMIIHCGNDITNMENSIGMWKIIFVDNAINGNGMSELMFEKREEIWTRALEILHDCTCGKKEGCIKCTMDYGCQRKNKSLIKDQIW